MYVVPSKEANTTKLWKLNKPVYALNEASLQWYNRVSDELIKMGIQRCKLGEALFYLHLNESLAGFITVHVDDFLFEGLDQFHKNIIDPLQSIFDIGGISSAPMIYLGINITQTADKIMIDQNEYIQSLEEVKITDTKDNGRPFKSPEHKEYRRLCGRLNWIPTQIRSDIAFDVAIISSNVSALTINHLKMANKIVRKVKSTSLEISFCKLKWPLHLSVHCDASSANLPNVGSQGGKIVFLTDGNGFMSPLSWTSRKLRSTISAETMSMPDTVDMAIWVTHILKDIKGNTAKSAQIKTDSKSLHDTAHSTTAV